MPRGPKRQKRVDDTHYLGGKRRGAVLKEEVWYEGASVIKYSLAYINPNLCTVDNGRVLGYDNGHNYHPRHFMGQTEDVPFRNYEEIADRFHREVYDLWRREDEDQ